MRYLSFGLAFLSAALMAPAFAQAPVPSPSSKGQGAVLIESDNAQNATVLVDGERRARMPADAEIGLHISLPAGSHTIELRRSVHNQFYDLRSSTTVTVENDALVPVTLAPLVPAPLPDAEERINAVIASFPSGLATIPAGSFTMGGRDEEDSSDNEFPRHKVTIPHAFLLQKRNVTFDQWDACVADGGCAHVPDDESHGRGDREVFSISWKDARLFATWLSRRLHRECRLPTEAEWEYAARAGTQTTYFFGDDPAPMADYVGLGGDYPGAVQPRLPNAFGLFGMTGGVTEWAADCWHANYRGAPGDGSAWENGDCRERVVRGGFWDASAWYMRPARRSAMNPANRYNYVGLRLVCAADR